MSYLSRLAEVAPSITFSSEELAYYARHLLLPGIGTLGQQKLKAARVLVVGAGGLGCPALQALAGAGVGQLTIADGDTVALSNLARQWLHRSEDVGRNKAESAGEALRSLNPFIQLEVLPEMLAATNADELILKHDVVVDATDDLEVRYLIDLVCAQRDRPWVHAALYRESAQFTVFWERCGARFSQLYPDPSDAPSCAGAGMLGAVASVAANFQALEVIKLITGNAVPKVGEVCSLQAVSLQLQTFKLPNVSPPELCVSKTASSAEHEWSLEDLRQAQSIGQPLRILDLRAASDFSAGSIADAERMAAETILEEGLSTSQQIFLVCETGLLSGLLADALRSRGHRKVYHLSGGVGG